MNLKLLTKDQYDANARANPGSHWAKSSERWVYHHAAIEAVRQLELPDTASVLEMGTMGASIVNGSDTIDYSKNRWDFQGFEPTHFHDATDCPWPIKKGSYDLFVALRVWQHLHPHQKAAFDEAKRVARNIVMVIPIEYPDTTGFGDQTAGVTVDDLVAWNNGVEPSVIINLGSWYGNLIVWRESTLC